MLSTALEELKVLDLEVLTIVILSCSAVFVSAFSHFSDYICSLVKASEAKAFLQTKAGSVGSSSQGPTRFPLIFLFSVSSFTFNRFKRWREGSELGVFHS